MNNDNLPSILAELMQIESDTSVPKNVRARIKKAITALESDGKDEVRVDRALEELSEVDDDPNLHQYTRTQIWSVVSALEEK